MAKNVVKVVLNQQQLELLDRTIERGIAPDRAELIRLALREFAARHGTKGGDSAGNIEND